MCCLLPREAGIPTHPWNVPRQVGWGLEQLGLVESIPARDTSWVDLNTLSAVEPCRSGDPAPLCCPCAGSGWLPAVCPPSSWCRSLQRARCASRPAQSPGCPRRLSRWGVPISVCFGMPPLHAFLAFGVSFVRVTASISSR